MFGRVHKAVNCFPIIAVLVSCSRPIEVPPLEKYEPHPVERIVFGNRIGAKEIRELFRALNSDRKLDGLKPFFVEPSDEELDRLGAILQAELFEKNELLEIIKLRGRRKGFSDWSRRAEEFKKRPAFPTFNGTFGKILESRHLPELLERDVRFLAPSIAADWKRTLVHNSVLEENDWVRKNLKSSAENLHQAFLDLGKLLENEDFLPASEELWQRAVRERLLDVITRTLSELTESEKTETLSDSASGHGDFQKLLGFQVGINEIWDNESNLILPGQAGNALEFLVGTASLYASPSDHMFERFSARLKEPQLRELFAPVFRQRVVQGLAEPLLEGWQSLEWTNKQWLDFALEPTKTDGPLFNQLLAKNLEVLASFSGPLPDENQSDFLQKNLSNYLIAYLLTDWWRSVANIPENRAKLMSGEKEIWSLTFVSPDYKLAFSAEREGRLHFELSDRVTSTAWKTFHQLFRRWIEKEPSLAEAYNFSMSAAVGELGLRSLVAVRLLEIETIAPRTDTGEVFRILLSKLTGKSFPNLASLESNDSLRDFLRFAGSLPLEQLRSAERFLFEDLNLKELSPAMQENILLIFSDEAGKKYRTKASLGLQALPLIPLLDVPAHGELPSPIVTLHSLLSHSAPAEMNWTSEAIRWVTKVKLFTSNRDANNVRHDTYPGIKGLMSSSLPVSIFYRLGRFSPESSSDLQQAIQEAFRNRGIAFHRSLYLSLSATEPVGTATSAFWFATEFLPLLLDREFLTDEERRWLMEVVSSHRLRGLHEFCFAESRKAYFWKALRVFRQLAQSGELTKVFSLLDLVKHERLREIATVLRALTDSGELTALLDFALTFQPGVNSK